MAVQEKIKNKETEKFTILSIAMDAGFNSKATFNRAFKKFAGMSPTEYQRKLAS
jgi:AraC-like DNA-binding protein